MKWIAVQVTDAQQRRLLGGGPDTFVVLTSDSEVHHLTPEDLRRVNLWREAAAYQAHLDVEAVDGAGSAPRSQPGHAAEAAAAAEVSEDGEEVDEIEIVNRLRGRGSVKAMQATVAAERELAAARAAEERVAVLWTEDDSVAALPRQMAGHDA